MVKWIVQMELMSSFVAVSKLYASVLQCVIVIHLNKWFVCEPKWVEKSKQWSIGIMCTKV